MGDNNQDEVTQAKRKWQGIRTLTYADIRKGILKAGPLPETPDDNLHLACWLAGAGYGRACLPSLKLWYRFKAAMKEHRGKTIYRRRGGNAITQGTMEAWAKQFGITYPGVRKQGKDRPSRAKQATRSLFHRGLNRSSSSDQPLRDRFDTWKAGDGIRVNDFLYAHGADLSTTHIIKRQRIEGETRQRIFFATADRRVLTIVTQADSYPSAYPIWERLYRINTKPYPIVD